MAEHANVKAFVACDKIIEEAKTQKKSLIGLFNNFNFPTLPARHSSWFLFAQIANLEAGNRDITINIVHDATQGVVFSAKLSIPEKHPENIDICIPANPTVFDKEGNYDVTLNIDGSQHASFILKVALVKQVN